MDTLSHEQQQQLTWTSFGLKKQQQQKIKRNCKKNGTLFCLVYQGLMLGFSGKNLLLSSFDHHHHNQRYYPADDNVVNMDEYKI